MSRNTAFASKDPVIPDVPTEELILNILIKRHSLGDPLWPFDMCHLRALKSPVSPPEIDADEALDDSGIPSENREQP